MIYYRLFSEEEYSDDLGTYVTYGIAAESENGIIRLIGDLSLDRDKVEALTKAYNEARLSPEHLDEAVENFLYNFEV